MFNLKHLIAAITLGTAMLMAPSAVSAKPVHRSTTAAHPLKHKKKKHKRVHHRHSKKTAATHVKSTHLAARSSTKHLAAASSLKHKSLALSSKTGSRHHPNL